MKIGNRSILLGISFVFALLPLTAKDSNAQHIMGARYVSMGQTGVAMAESNWSAFNNAALMRTDKHHVSFYGFRYVGISEITDMAAVVNYRSDSGTFGLGLHRYGFDLFNENRLLLAYKNSAGKFHYGGSISYFHVNQGGNYGSAGAVGIGLAIAAEVIDDVWFGARATNVNQPAYGNTDEELPRELAAGFSYSLSDQALITAELVKDVKFPISFRSGLEFEIVPLLFLRTGITTEPLTYALGFGYAASLWEVNFGLQQHDPLGLSPALDLTLRF
ncbi:MAG: hypothetical protein EA390_08830 [Balneolaceae bacterium]|nr:MAG: hypothetical protein EA390_08830 [Balneolaceae bacterium]